MSPRQQRRERAGLATSARNGFTLVELAISMVLVAVLLGLFFMTTQAASSAVNTGVAVAELDALAQRSLERVCEDLKSSSLELATPQAVAPFSADTIDYQRRRGLDAGGNPVWGPLERLSFEYDEANDGIDNDGDGLVDEGRLVWSENPGAASERRVILAADVREYLAGETLDGTDQNGNGLLDEHGFALDFTGRSVAVRLTLEICLRPGQLISSTAQRTITLRNEGN
jgi:prepilin-type N-terminal cleavage/methylation domain-containing protein